MALFFELTPTNAGVVPFVPPLTYFYINIANVFLSFFDIVVVKVDKFSSSICRNPQKKKDCSHKHFM